MTTSDYKYDSLQEIRQRKIKLQGEISLHENEMRVAWNQLFHGKEKKGVQTPSKRITGMISTGMGVLDGIILGWKLYRRFKK